MRRVGRVGQRAGAGSGAAARADGNCTARGRRGGALADQPTSRAEGGGAGGSAEEQGDGLVRVQAQVRHAPFDIRRFQQP